MNPVGSKMALKFAVSPAAPVAPPASPEAAPFHVTEKAAKRIAEILTTEPEGTFLRVAVEGGGCSGFQYRFAMERSPAPDDRRIEAHGAVVLVDPVSAPYLAGSELDFVTELLGQSFQIRNPNAKTACGCGTSFSL